MKYQLILRVLDTLIFAPLLEPYGVARAQPLAVHVVAPQIERFDLDAPNLLAPGEALSFRITGTPGASASVSIAGVKNKVALREVMMGVYEGAYTIRRGDKVEVDSVVTGQLTRGNQRLSALLGKPLVDVSALAAAQTR